MQSNNPYASAAGAYGTNAQKTSSDPREVEGRVLLKSAQFMQDLQSNWDSMDKDSLEETLKYNRSIWLMFFDTAVENAEGDRPGDLRNNIYNLAKFVFKREIDILAKPEKNKLDILIKINRDIAGGLLAGVKNTAPHAAMEPAQSAVASDPAATQATPSVTPPSSSATAASENRDGAQPPSGGWDSSA